MYKHKWYYNDKEAPEGCCYDCRMKYSVFPDMEIPNDLWRRINPRSDEEGGLLCPTCIASRLDYLGLWSEDDLFILKRKQPDRYMEGYHQGKIDAQTMKE